MHLYVTPSHLVLITGLVILALCALLSIIIALLHLKEKVTLYLLVYVVLL